MSTTKTGPVIEHGGVRFWLPDPGEQVGAVRLYQEVRGAQRLLDMTRGADGFEVWLDSPAVHRMEYLFELTHPDGSTSRVLDPGNQMSIDGAFGEKSVLEFPDYVAPLWLSGPAAAGEQVELPAPSQRLGTTMPGRLWHPTDTPPDRPVPLLVVQDGFEFDSYADLTRWAAAAVARGWLPPFRIALLHPEVRIDWYAANSAYAGALVEEMLPAIGEKVAVAGRPVLTGASLGGLAALHAHLLHPGVWGGLFLQSGSFFTQLPEGREESLQAIPPFVANVHAASMLAEPVPTVLTAGVIERNLANIRRMAGTLAARGYEVDLHEVPDGHNYTAWRDSLHPHLTTLLASVWRATEA